MCAMARSHAARQRRRPVPARRQAGQVARAMRACIATAAVALSAALPLLGGQADAQQSNALTVAQPAGAPLALTVTSVSPSYAEQGRTVTITGRVRNLAAAPATGLSLPPPDRPRSRTSARAIPGAGQPDCPSATWD